VSAAEPLSAARMADGARLLDLLLEEQAQLSAVERFSQHHDDARTPLLASHYEALVPATAPRPGEQYAFRVDLDACTGCKACVTACHSLNGLAPDETWRKVGRLVGGTAEAPLQQTVTTACHHCEDPGCLAGCPVKAYEKDPETGIVRHLDDQCIGCKYCTLTCPYDVPQYSESLGIVRKCDLCHDRLAVGEAPACVQGCPNGAIEIRVVSRRGAGAHLGSLLPAPDASLPDSGLTRPTTRYVSQRLAGATLEPADLDRVAPNHAHWPLAALLVATQLSVGTLSFVVALAAVAGIGAAWLPGLAAAFGFALVGQAAAFAHLGRPQYAFRAILGLRTSWMSREIAVLGAYTGALASLLGLAAVERLAPAWLAPLPDGAPPALLALLAAGAVALGWGGVLTSAMIYVATGRPLWAWRRTAPRFAGAAASLGLAFGLALAIATGALTGLAAAASAAALAAVVARRRLGEERGLAVWRGSSLPALRRSAALLDGALVARRRLRATCAALGGSALVAAGLAAGLGFPALASAPLALAGFAFLLAGELLEGHLFFVAEAATAMPGH